MSRSSSDEEPGENDTQRSAASTGGPLSSSKGEVVKRRQAPALLRPIASRSSPALRDKEDDRALHRRVVSGLPKARRYVDPNQIELCLTSDFVPKSAQSSVAFEQHLSGDNARGKRRAVVRTPGQIMAAMESAGSPNPASVLGSGPLAVYPIDVTAVDRWILNRLFASPDPALRTFRENWLPIAINDTAMFHQLLASVTWRIRKLRGEDPQNVVSMAHHSLAIRIVNARLSDPEHIKSDYSIFSVAMLVCYSIVTDDYVSFTAHIEGLRLLIQIRGGFKALEKNLLLRKLLFGVDVSGAYRHDQPPLFPFPEKFLLDHRGNIPFETFSSGASSRLSSPSRTPWEQIIPTDNPLSNIFEDISDAIMHSERKTLHDEIWIKVDFVAFWIDPIAYKVLLMKADVNAIDPWSIIQEVTRLGILLFFGEIRRKCGALAVSTLLQMKKLQALMISVGENADWSNYKPLLLWVLFFGFFESWQGAEYDWYLEALVRLADQMKLHSWNAVTKAVREFVWITPIHDERLGKFRESFELERIRLEEQGSSGRLKLAIEECPDVTENI